MIEAESYGVSGRQLLSSKQVPASGRVCSWRNPRVCPNSCPRMSPGSQLPEDQIESFADRYGDYDDANTRNVGPRH